MALLGVWLCVVLLSAVPASALIVHRFETSFGGPGSGSGQFNTPTGVAVNDTTHDVYVVDRGNNRVEEFNSTGSVVLGEFNGSASPTGVFSKPERIAVDNSGSPLDPSAGDVYVVDNGHNVVDKFSASGVYEGQLTGTPSGPFAQLGAIAVDSSGNLWVIDGGEIDTFSDAQQNEFLSRRGTAYGGEITGEGSSSLAVDPEGDLYVKPAGRIVKLDSTGATLADPFSGRNAFGVTVGPVEREAYVAYDFAGEVPVEALGLDGSRIETFGAGHIGNAHAVAVDASNSTVYVTDIREERVDVFKGFHLPSVSVGALSEQMPRSVTLNGTVNPEGEPVVSCAFEYGTTSSYGQSAPCSPSPGSGSTPVAVSAHLTGLTPGDTYHYRLVASNSAGASPTPDREFVAGPIVSGEFLTDVTSESAVLHAGVNPNNGDTQYYFEYGLTTSYGTDVPLGPPGVDLGSGSATVPVSFHLYGLDAGVAYHYRLVVTQASEAFEGPDRLFTTQPAGGNELRLPDRRAWELVSPADKGGALIGPLQNPPLHGQAGAGGDGIAYAVNQPLGEAAGRSGVGGEAFSQRGTAGWRTRSITAPETLPPPGEYQKATVGVEYFMLFSPDLSLAALEPRGAFSPQIEGISERTDLLRNDERETYVPLVTPENVPAGTKIAGEENGTNSNEQMSMEAMTPDLSHVILHSAVALAPGAAPTSIASSNLYEWSEGQLQFIGEGQAGNGASYGQDLMTSHSVSTDGRWVVIMKQGEAGGSHSPVQYVVHDGMEGTSVPFGGPYTYFQTTSSDGSRVFFLETEHTSDRLHKEQGELYVFDPATGVTTGLTANHLDGEPNANVQNTVVASEDGSYVYFVATGVLAPGGTPGADNFYVLHYSNEHWTTTFIATLSSEDRPDWGPGDTSVNTPSFQLNQLDTRVSLDGQKVAFMSNRPLTGYDNVDAVSGHPDEEVYLYDASDGRLRCVSCNPTGARPLGVLDGGGGRGADSSALLIDGPRAWEEESAPQIVPVDSWVAGVLPAAWHQVGRVSLYQPRYVFDGGRLFFQSTDALVPQDTNGVADVYEYEPVKGPGVPASDDCTASSPTFSQVAGGCVSLISSGQSSSESAFVDASETGDDVFFVTNSKLVGEDYDNVYDMYDAHACGSGWACTSAPVSPPACTSGDSCKPAPSPQPAIFGPTPSETFNGAGNLTPPPRVVLRAKRKPCAKGRVRRHGVCVKSKHKHAKSSRSARKSMVHKGLGGSGR